MENWIAALFDEFGYISNFRIKDVVTGEYARLCHNDATAASHPNLGIRVEF